MNHIGFTVGAQFSAQIANIDVNDVGEMLGIVVPDMFRNRRAAQHLAWASHQEMEQGVFFPGERDRALSSSGLLCTGVERNIPKA